MLKKNKPLLISIGLALLALILGASYIKRLENELIDQSRPMPVLKATQDIQKNMPIEEQMLTVEEVPHRYVQPGALNHPNDAIGRLAESPIQKGEQIAGTKLITWGTETGLAVKVPPGKRAISVRVDDTTGVGGLIKPDNYVDVIASFNFGDQSKDNYQTHTLLQDVRVLAVARDLGVGIARKEKKMEEEESDRSGEKTTVTLALEPQEVQDLILAQQAGELTLALRSQSETEKTINLKASSILSLTGLQEKTMVRQPGYRQYRGGGR